MSEHLVSLGDGTFLDVANSIHYSADGVALSRLDEVECVPAGGNQIRGRTGRSDKNVNMSDVADCAAGWAAKQQALALGRNVTWRDKSGNKRKGVHAMDLSAADVHIQGQMAGAAAGYRLAEGCADLIAPVIQAKHQTDKIPIWDKEVAFARAAGTTAAPGGDVPTTTISLSTVPFSCVERALSIVMAVEVIENADAPLSPWATATRVVQERLLKEREHRVCKAAVTAANWDSTLVFDLGAAFGWATGASADPVKDIHTAVLASYDSTDLKLIMDQRMFLIMQRSPAVQKYTAYKNGINPLPSADQISAVLSLPPIVVQNMKTQTSAGLMKYVLEQEATVAGKTGAALLVRDTPGLSDPSLISTMKTIRWSGGMSPDGNMVAGWMVRTYFDPKKGGRGSYVVVVVHNDHEIFTSKFVGALITGCGQ